MFSNDYAFAREYRAYVLDDEVIAALGTPADAIVELMRVSGAASLKRLSETEFDTALESFFTTLDPSAESELVGLDDSESIEDLLVEADQNLDILDTQNDAPIIKLLNSILLTSIRRKASDIHLEPSSDGSRVRMRVDGVLIVIAEPRIAIAERLITRIKVLADLDIAERRLAQDGRITVRLGSRSIDLRVSTIPSMHGERVVLRILEKQSKNFDLEHLGLNSEQISSLRTLVAKPNGILLVTGPTGSGKTTTLYAALQSIATSERNIMTVEDPVEYDLKGISQTQISSKVGYGFAEGLKAILRQDPDVVLVGEIRDGETAEIAVQASLTGHLVFATLHTNSAAGAVTRLADLGVEPFLLSSSVRGVMAQRLVRLLCNQCKEPSEVHPEQTDLLYELCGERPEVQYQPVGCQACAGTGYNGRCGVYEFVEVTDRLKQLIHDGAGELDIEREIRIQAPSLLQAGARLVLNGKTTLEELFKVAVT